MSLGQLTANYTDSEGEEDGHSGEGSRDSANISLGQISANYTDSEDEEDSANTSNAGSVTSGTKTTVKKAVNGLVSYTLGADEDDDESEEDGDDEEDKDEVENSDIDLNPAPMDIGSDEEDELSTTAERVLDLGISLPPAPPGKAPQKLQDNVTKLVNNVRRGKNYNAIIQNKKEFRNPSIYEKLIDLLELDEMGSNYALDQFDPHFWSNSKDSMYDVIAGIQKEEMDKREKVKAKIEVISAGSRKSLEEDQSKARKSRFDKVG